MVKNYKMLIQIFSVSWTIFACKFIILDRVWVNCQTTYSCTCMMQAGRCEACVYEKATHVDAKTDTLINFCKKTYHSLLR